MVRETGGRVLAASAIEDFMAAVLAGQDMPPADAGIAARALIEASLAGVDTHGIVQFPGYLDLLRKGVTNPKPAIDIEDHGAFLKVEADRAMGAVAGMRALDAAIAKARELGSCVATIGRAGHLGALGYFVRHAAEKGMVSIAMQNCPPLMGLPGATRRAIGNSPIAFGAPVPGGAPIVFDIATSEAAYGKIMRARAEGNPIPEGWAMDENGAPTTDAAAAFGGILLPFGGSKGIGLAMMIDVMCGSLAGMRPVWGENLFGGFLMVVDPDAAGRAAYEVDIADWLGHYRGSGPGMRYPGERAAEIRAERERDGVPLGAALVETFRKIAGESGVAFPAS